MINRTTTWPVFNGIEEAIRLTDHIYLPIIHVYQNYSGGQISNNMCVSFELKRINVLITRL